MVSAFLKGRGHQICIFWYVVYPQRQYQGSFDPLKTMTFGHEYKRKRTPYIKSFKERKTFLSWEKGI